MRSALFVISNVEQEPPSLRAQSNCGVVAPGKTFSATYSWAPPPANAIKGLREGAPPVRLAGQIDYEDAFGRKQYTEFRLRSGLPGDRDLQYEEQRNEAS